LYDFNLESLNVCVLGAIGISPPNVWEIVSWNLTNKIFGNLDFGVKGSKMIPSTIPIDPDASLTFRSRFLLSLIFAPIAIGIVSNSSSDKTG
jgi:hypothetical protein